LPPRAKRRANVLPESYDAAVLNDPFDDPFNDLYNDPSPENEP
jgi:hypothetical protein